MPDAWVEAQHLVEAADTALQKHRESETNYPDGSVGAMALEAVSRAALLVVLANNAPNMPFAILQETLRRNYGSEDDSHVHQDDS